MSFPSFRSFFMELGQTDFKSEMESLLENNKERAVRGKLILKKMASEYKSLQPRTSFNIFNPFHKETTTISQETNDVAALKLYFYQWLLMEGLDFPDKKILEATQKLATRLERVDQGL